MYRLKQGDCLDLLKSLPDKSINLICADLPYGTTQCKWDVIIPLEPLWKELNRIAKDNTAIILFAQTPFDKVLGCSNLEMLRYEWIWEKTAATGHLNSKKMPMKAHENILVFYRKLPTYNPQKTHGHTPVNSYSKKDNSDGDCYGNTLTASGGGNTDRHPRSVQLFSSDKQKIKLNSTQKPLKLLEYIIRTYTNVDDTVLDFCMGSGTTIVASVNLNRNAIGFELDKNSFNSAKERISKAQILKWCQ